MRLDFNVLWVDDQPDRVAAQIKRIARLMEAEGFEFKPTLCRSTADVRERIKEDVFNDEVDLVLIDWDLGEGAKGEDAIAEIRSEIQYKDVVFYSALKGADELRRLAFDKGAEGVYCASRTELVTEVMGVFESLVKKVLDLDHTRGIVLSATCDIDQMVNECLLAVHGKLDGDGQKQMLEDALKLVEDRMAGLGKSLEKLRAEGSVAAVLEANMMFTAYDRLRVLSRALKLEQFGEYKGSRSTIITYMEEVVPERNILAHQVISPEGKPIAVVHGSGKQIKLDEMRGLRRTILALRGDFRTLHAKLTS